MWMPCISLGSRVNFDPQFLAPRVEFAEIVDREAQFDRAGGVLVGGGVKRDDGVAGRELRSRRATANLELEPELVAVEGDRALHVGDIFDGVGRGACPVPPEGALYSL